MSPDLDLDLEALARAIIARADPAAWKRQGPRAAIIVNADDLAGFFDEVAPVIAATVDAAAVARCAKALRAACERHFESIRIWKLRKLADELEADHE